MHPRSPAGGRTASSVGLGPCRMDPGFGGPQARCLSVEGGCVWAAVRGLRVPGYFCTQKQERVRSPAPTDT